jgi:hypothetical protein
LQGICLDPVNCLFAPDDACIKNGKKDSSQRTECEVYGGVIYSQAATREGGAEQVHLGKGDEVAGVDEVYQGSDLKLVPASRGSSSCF